MDSAASNAVVEGSIVRVEHEPAALAPGEYHSRATQAAGFVKAIVLGKAVKIGPKLYTPVDAYQAIANAMGCVGSAGEVRRVEGGWTAQGEVKRLSDGMVIARGEGFVGNDEPKWAKGPEYAARSMAQTRAIGRACRAAFAFVVPMIDLGLSSTPAEEMDGISAGSETPPRPVGTAGIRQALSQPPPSPPHTVASAVMQHAERPLPTSPPTHNRQTAFAFGRDKGVIVADLSEASLKWYADCFNRDLADNGKANFHEKTRAQLACVIAEMKFRGI